MYKNNLPHISTTFKVSVFLNSTYPREGGGAFCSEIVLFCTQFMSDSRNLSRMFSPSHYPFVNQGTWRFVYIMCPNRQSSGQRSQVTGHRVMFMDVNLSRMLRKRIFKDHCLCHTKNGLTKKRFLMCRHHRLYCILGVIPKFILQFKTCFCST